MSHVASAALVEALDGSGLYTEERNLGLWQQVPAELRLTEFSPRTLPDHPAFRWRLGCRPAGGGFGVRAVGAPARSLIDRSLQEWEHELIKERARPTGKLGWPHWGPGVFRRCYRHLLIAYDPRAWWQHAAWSPRFDARIPLRQHEPTTARAGYDFLVIE